MNRCRTGLAVSLVCLITVLALPAGRAMALDNGLARTPPMGWNSWNQVKCYDVSEQVVKDAADAIVDSGLREAGYEYVVVDDCWQGGRGADGRLFSDPERFPSGIAALADYVHARGLKFGIYSVPGSLTCANTWDNYPVRGIGSLGYEQVDADTFAAWGVDYLKYDWCQAERDGIERQAAFAEMRDALAATGRPIVYSISEYGETQPWQWGPDIANLWRTTSDIAPNWSAVSSIIERQAELAPHAGPGGWNDPDMLQIGNGSLTPAENRSHFAMWAMLASPLMLGTDLTALDAETREIVANRSVIAIDQDPLGRQAERIRREAGYDVWRKELSGGRYAVALLNTGGASADLRTTFTELGVTGRYRVTDAWTGQVQGQAGGRIGTSVASHDTALYVLTPVGR
ncbi:glycoside hydrolase family 27 protein [Naumannella huperziae]